LHEESTTNKKRKARGKEPHINENSTFVASQPKKVRNGSPVVDAGAARNGSSVVDAGAATILASLSNKNVGRVVTVSRKKAEGAGSESDSDGGAPSSSKKKKPVRKAAPKIVGGTVFSSILMDSSLSEKQKGEYVSTSRSSRTRCVSRASR